MKSIETIEMTGTSTQRIARVGEYGRRVTVFAHIDGDDFVRIVVTRDEDEIWSGGHGVGGAEARLRRVSPELWGVYVRVLAEHGYHPVTLDDVGARAA